MRSKIGPVLNPFRFHSRLEFFSSLFEIHTRGCNRLADELIELRLLLLGFHVENNSFIRELYDFAVQSVVRQLK